MTLTLLREVSGAEWRAHPWRQCLAVLAVALGVALAFSVHLINRSALSEFSAAVRAANGQPDLALACTAREGCDDSLAHVLAVDPAVQVASPVVEIDSYAVDRQGRRVPLRLLGLDALLATPVAPQLRPQPAAGEERTAFLDPEAVFLNAAALQRLGVREGDTVAVQHGLGAVTLRVAGTLAAGGAPLAVLDIAGAQAHFGFSGRLTRLDLRLAAGADARPIEARAGAAWRAVRPDDAAARVSNVSLAYRVNLTVLALVALVVGAFLVFSVLALSVAQRTPSLALLGVLGLAARERAALVRAECALIGVAGSALGVAAGTALAALALRHLGGDLGGGYFPGVMPSLQFSWPAALAFGAAGTGAALAGGWLPARQAAALAPAQALKGLGGAPRRHAPRWSGPALLALGGALALLPPLGGLPVAAYASVALLLVGGIACVPIAIDALLGLFRPGHRPLALLALQRARHERDAAAVAVAGVVASLALAIALTVMVASFREGVARWLDDVLPADLYVRSAAQSSTSDQAFLDPAFLAAAPAIAGVARVEVARSRPLAFDPQRPAVVLYARPLDAGGAVLPLLGPALPPHATLPGVFVSEPMQTLYGTRPGQALALPLGTRTVEVYVRGVWRDYARQFGAVAMDLADYRRATGDQRLNDMALWLAPGARLDEVQRALREAARRASAGSGADALLDFAAATQLRTLSLEIFDRSFAVTTYLQAVAIAIGLAGIAASFSAQVLARRREFGLLAHLGLTRAELVRVVAGEAAAWTGVGAVVGLALGLGIAVVLVHVVNPQSFHWTMDMHVPAGRTAALLAAVLLAGVATATLAARAVARRAGARDMVAAVKEDW
ncbi:MAG TPA: ABC transporter permease [Burkholderiaceae bacterium]|nr:ABC transporter permease [Burkholderiaceae bacterium]